MEEEFRHTNISEEMTKMSKEEKLDKITFCKGQAKMAATIDIMRKFYYKKFMLNPHLINMENKLAKLAEWEENYDDKSVWYIVINPSPGYLTMYGIKEFEKKCLKALNKKWIFQGCLWFEWRKAEEKNSIHANFLFKKSKYPFSRVRSEFWNTFKDCVRCHEDDKIRDNLIYIQNERESTYDNFLSYKDKKGKEHDRNLRVFWGLEDIYRIGIEVNKKDNKKPIDPYLV